jgi:hypothetical protein
MGHSELQMSVEEWVCYYDQRQDKIWFEEEWLKILEQSSQAKSK